MQAPLVSVIIPIYKVEPYLRRCVNSVINQSYTNLEIILVDDGSPDKCSAICDEYAQNDRRIKVIHKQNGGLSSARNVGLHICKGLFITFVDSDDWIETNYIEVLYNLQGKYNADIVVGENQIRKDTANVLTKQELQDSSETILDQNCALKHLFLSNNHTYVVSWGKLYKKELLTGFQFPIGKYHEDEFTTFQLFYKAKRICYTNKILYNYFQRPGNITSTDHPNDLLEAYECSFRFFKEKEGIDFLPFLFQRLCWQLLYAYTKQSNIENSPINHKIHQYRALLPSYKLPLFHKTLLTFFMKKPFLYKFFRVYSPLHIRKEIQ